MADPTPIRCAIYTRKSSEEGLEQAYNSLDAQRDACEAYVRSQTHERWTLIETAYDDGGFSGGDMRRPALQALLADVQAGLVDVVVVYKIDRLTRALIDFAKIVAVLDDAKASFVAVTQAFNTTTSMGRLTLNVLLSFAQFEREITSERIRDKIASSRAKGMWMGGRAPFGYDRLDGGLVVNEREAADVRRFFDQFLKLGSISAVVDYGVQQNILGKERLHHGVLREPRHFCRGGMTALLVNPVYIGKIRHKEALFDGKHSAIIKLAVFEKAGRMIAARSRKIAEERRAAPTYLLDGLLKAPSGEPFVGENCRQLGYKVQWYVAPIEGARIPKICTGATDRAVVMALCGFLDNLRSSHPVDGELGVMISTLKSGLRGQVEPMLRSVLQFVILNDTAMTLTLRLRSAALGGALTADTDFTVGIIEKRSGGGSLVIADHGGRSPDLNLVKLLGRATYWFEELVSYRVSSVTALAKQEGLSACYIGNTMELAFLAPDLKQEIFEGRQPFGLTATALKEACPLPVTWERQRELIKYLATVRTPIDREAIARFKGKMPRREMPWLPPKRKRSRRPYVFKDRPVAASPRGVVEPGAE